MTEAISEIHPITAGIDARFDGVPYSDPSAIQDLVSARVRSYEAVDGPRGDLWTVVDVLLVGEADGQVVNTRGITFARFALDGSEIFFEFVSQNGTVTPSGELPVGTDGEAISEMFMRGFDLIMTDV